MMQHTRGLKSLPLNNYIFLASVAMILTNNARLNCSDPCENDAVVTLSFNWENSGTMRVRADCVYQHCHYTFKSSERNLVMKEILIVGYQTDSKFSNRHNRSAAFLLLICGLLRGVGVFTCCHKDWTSTENYLQNTLKPYFIISTYRVLSLLLSFPDNVCKLP